MTNRREERHVQNGMVQDQTITQSRPGRPRDPALDNRVLHAAREELADTGVAGFSVRSVARRAGVARPTVSARWPDRDALILDALDDAADLPEFEPTDDIRSDLLVLVDQLAAILSSPVLRLQQRLAADSDRYPELFARFQDKVMRTTARRFERVITAAASRGELATDVDYALAADCLVGVLVVRTFASDRQRPPGPAARRRIVDSTLKLFRDS